MRLFRARLAWLPFLSLDPTQLLAQVTENPAVEQADASVAEQTPVVPAVAIWMAGVNGGYIGRDGGASSSYATLSLTRFHKQTYLRAAFTAYRGTLTQLDAALPSTYYIGSLGAGGNFDDWVIDTHLSYGRQIYGQIETALGKRQSQLSSTGYFGAGVRGGRVFRPAPRWYLTPTIAVDCIGTKSLRHRIEQGRPIDFEVQERAWSGAGSLRVDRTFGKDEQNFVGLTVSHHVSSNGLTKLTIGGAPVGLATTPTPDSWQELEASTTIQLRSGLWLDGQVRRSFGAVGSDTTLLNLGMRLRL